MSDRLLSRPYVMVCLTTALAAHAPNLLTLLPRHLRHAGLDERAIGVVMGAMPLASIFTMPLVARASDTAGRRAPVLLGLLLCALACASFERCTGFPAFLAARVVCGVGWAFVLVGGSILVTEIAPPGRLAQALGGAGVLTLAAMALGPTVGELILAHTTFDWLFRVAAALSLLGLVFGLTLPPWPSGRRPRGGRGGVGLVLDVPVRRPLAATFLIAAGFGAIQSFLADYTTVFRLGAIAPFFHAYVIMAILARLTLGRISDTAGRLPVILPALAAQALALVGIGLARAGWALIPAGGLFGFSHGVYYPALQALAIERAPVARRGTAIASFNFAFSGGMAASAFVNGFVAAHAGYPAVYFGCAGLAVAAAVVVGSLRKANGAI